MMLRALKAEVLKLKRAHVVWWTALVVAVYAIVNTVMTASFKDPGAGARMAQAGGSFAKAAAAGMYEPTWENFLRFIPQGIGGGIGALLFGFVAAYVFGREFKERTDSVMLVTPIRREYFVAAKLAVLFGWVTSLALLWFVLQTAGTALVGAERFAWAGLLAALGDSMKATLLIYLTLPFVAWVAWLRRGYLWPMVFTVVAMTLSNGFIFTEFARYYPWDMPLLVAGASWIPIPPASLVPGSWLVAVAVFALGAALLGWQVDRSDARA